MFIKAKIQNNLVECVEFILNTEGIVAVIKENTNKKIILNLNSGVYDFNCATLNICDQIYAAFVELLAVKESVIYSHVSLLIM